MDKIIVITSNIAPYRKKWCEQLASFYDVTIVYTKDHDYERDDRWLQKSSDACKIVKLKNDKDLFDPLCFDVITLLRKNKDALIIFDGYGPKTNLLGLLYCKMSGRFSYVNVDGYPTERVRSGIKEAIKRFVIRRLCTGFTCSGEAARDHLVSYGVDPDKIIIHNFSSISEKQIIERPLKKNEKLELRKKLGIASGKKIVLGVGRFLPLKRFEDLIEAVKKCESDCDLYILGGKPLNSYLQLTEGSDRFHFIDFVVPEEVNDYYKACDLFVLPSETDVWGLVVNEAMAQGLPVIASDSVVGAYSLIRNNGMMFRTYDVDELSRDIDLCLEEKRNREMSEMSLKIIRDFTIENMVRRQKPYFDAYFKKNRE
ncbi:MAG: glycosyltransferase family 4 protein [Erysipelotrichaceae bacterium]|nr:glycosyltransferase family 4 protein [Erysipelotrichaceae bacterium]